MSSPASNLCPWTRIALPGETSDWPKPSMVDKRDRVYFCVTGYIFAGFFAHVAAVAVAVAVAEEVMHSATRAEAPIATACTSWCRCCVVDQV
jgi:hypothetical protein